MFRLRYVCHRPWRLNTATASGGMRSKPCRWWPEFCDLAHSRGSPSGIVGNPRYSPDMGFAMHIFTFKSQSRPELTGRTTWRTGANLPEDLGPWLLVSQSAMHAGESVPGVHGGADTVIAEIDRHGFYIGRVDFRRERKSA